MLGWPRTTLIESAAASCEVGADGCVGGVDDGADGLMSVIDAGILDVLETSTWRTDAGDMDVLARSVIRVAR